jgi:hypothetical protein
MAHPFDLDALAKAVAKAVSDVVAKDISSMSGFSKTQLHAMAKQSAWIAEATAKKELTKAQRDFFLKDLARMAMNFVKVLKGLTMLAVEKAWNAAVAVLWKAMEGVIGTALPFPV